VVWDSPNFWEISTAISSSWVWKWGIWGIPHTNFNWEHDDEWSINFWSILFWDTPYIRVYLVKDRSSTKPKWIIVIPSVDISRQ
jgi:hypothetical protein